MAVFSYQTAETLPPEEPDKTVVLFVDDDPSILEGVRDLLLMNGYEVMTAQNGRTALEMMFSMTPDLIVSDIKMPEMDGFEFYEAVRSNPTWTLIPFIFLTAFAQASYLRQGQRMGVDAYLTKPFEAEDLIIAIETRLKRVRDIQTASEASLEQLKQQLLTVFSHELRTPLTYIYGYVHLLQDTYLEMEREAIGTMLSGIRAGADRLVRLVDDLMLLIRLDMGVIQVEVEQRKRQLEVASILERVRSMNLAEAAVKELELRVVAAPSLTIAGIEDYVVDAISRVVDNAIKFSHKKPGQVMMQAAQDGMYVKVSVTDEGIGIAPHVHDVIFERFSQVDRDRLEQQGLGMGLSIVRREMDAHNGSIEVESEPGAGSTFILRFPSTA